MDSNLKPQAYTPVQQIKPLLTHTWTAAIGKKEFTTPPAPGMATAPHSRLQQAARDGQEFSQQQEAERVAGRGENSTVKITTEWAA